jgi:hypothetical protein
VCARDLESWQQALGLADADLRNRQREALTGEPTAAELRAFAAEHDKLATDTDSLADARDEVARARDAVALGRDVEGSARDRAARAGAEDLDDGFADRFQSGADRDLAAGDRADSVDDRHHAAAARHAAAADRQRAADDRDAMANRDERAQREQAELTHALETRLVIGQAEGLLMARYDLGPESAFRLLVKLSQESHVKLREVAARLVADATGQAEQPRAQ